MSLIQPDQIIISRTDSIGDVVLTLPLAGILKEHFPRAEIVFLGQAYTRPVISTCKFVDKFLDSADFLKSSKKDFPRKSAIIHVFPVRAIAQKAKSLSLKWRIGTKSRLYHWLTCNHLVSLSRKNSELHEAQLNAVLLQPLGINQNRSLQELAALTDMSRLETLREVYSALLAPEKKHIILHPKSQGSGREWGLENFALLIDLLPEKDFQIFISGTQKERLMMDELFRKIHRPVEDITGTMELSQFISFIDHCDALVAASTGPLHIAATLGIKAVGIYPPMRPIHPGRWAPLGKNTEVFVSDKNCDDCKKNAMACICIKEVSSATIAASLRAL